MDHSASFSRNIILSRLRRDAAFGSIEKKFEFVDFAVHDTMQEADKPIRSIYFPLSGMLSTVIQMTDGGSSEVCCIGCDGMVNWESLFGQRKSYCRHFAQLGGDLARIAYTNLLPFALHPAIARYVIKYSNEVSQNCACNSLHGADQRLAKWLLVAADKVESEAMALTQEFLAYMLGSRRATVTIAAGKLQDAGLIWYRRGSVQILNRPGLIEAACECYSAAGAD